MDQRQLADLVHANVIAANTLIGAGPPGAVVRRSDGVASFSTGLPVILFNQVVVEHAEATADAIGAAIRFMRDRGSAFVVNLRVGMDDRFVGLMGELGLARMSDEPWLPGMALAPIPTDGLPDAPPGHEIRRVTDDAGLADHVRTGALGFDMPEELLGAIMPGTTLDADGVTVYVGYVDGEAVTTGLGLRTGRTIGVYSIATIPTHRGRGYGGAMTSRVAADGAAMGCDVAILQASSMGYPVYERLGYRTVVEYLGYVEPPDGGSIDVSGPPGTP